MRKNFSNGFRDIKRCQRGLQDPVGLTVKKSGLLTRILQHSVQLKDEQVTGDEVTGKERPRN